MGRIIRFFAISSGYWAFLKDQPPSGTPALAHGRFLVSRRPIRTQRGTPSSRASDPRFLQPCTQPSRGPHRSLTVVPSIRIEGTTVRLRRGFGGMSGREGREGLYSTHYPENAGTGSRPMLASVLLDDRSNGRPMAP